MVSILKGALYVVATPIGNLGDISARALEVLRQADVVAAEDTRHSLRLLQHFGIAPGELWSYHDHNEATAAGRLLAALQSGRSVALISDAGTPLISDPGFELVRAARRAGVPVVPIPGASAVMAALSVAGLPTDRYAFEGFLPAKQAARTARLEGLSREPRTLVFYESSHRIGESLADMVTAFGAEREAVMARELTKVYEDIQTGTLAELHAAITANVERCRGEFVVVVAGSPAAEADAIQVEGERVLKLLLEQLPVKAAVKLAAQITGAQRNWLYERALELAGEGRAR